MRIQFHCVHKAQIYYEVILGGEALFCGTKGECKRFIVLHNEKVRATVSEWSARVRVVNRVPRARRATAVRLHKAVARVAR